MILILSPFLANESGTRVGESGLAPGIRKDEDKKNSRCQEWPREYSL